MTCDALGSQWIWYRPMSEGSELVQLTCTRDQFRPAFAEHVRWLDWESDFGWAQAYWPPEHPLTREIWDEARQMGFHYCAIIRDDTIVSLAAEYRYSPDAWMVAAVSTAPGHRRQGYAKATVSFVTRQILNADKLATCFTKKNNIAMIRTAQSIGFQLKKRERQQ